MNSRPRPGAGADPRNPGVAPSARSGIAPSRHRSHRFARRLPAAAGLLLTAAGCAPAMHAMGAMHGMGHPHGASAHAARPAATPVVEQVRAEGQVYTLQVPPLLAGQPATWTLSIEGTPVVPPAGEPTVTFAIRRAAAGGSGHQRDHGSGGAGAQVRLAATAAAPGTYRATHTFAEPGTFEIAATVAGIGGAPGVTVSATQEVRPPPVDHGEGSGRRAPLALLGGLAMLAMMALKVAWLL